MILGFREMTPGPSTERLPERLSIYIKICMQHILYWIITSTSSKISKQFQNNEYCLSSV